MYLDLLGEGGTEHHGLAHAFRWHCILLHDTSDLGLKAHVQHTIGLIQHKVATGNDTQTILRPRQWTTYSSAQVYNVM